MRQSDTISELAAALAKAQGEFEHARKDRENTHFKNQYATLASLLDACRGPLTANGLSVVQGPSGWNKEAGVVEVTTMLLHKSGQFIETTTCAPLGKSDVQAVGSAITYLRRYALAAVVGIAPADDTDDDGQAAAAAAPQRRAPSKPDRAERTETPQARFADAMRARWKRMPRMPEEHLVCRELYGVDDWWEVSTEDAEEGLALLEECDDATLKERLMKAYNKDIPF